MLEGDKQNQSPEQEEPKQPHKDVRLKHTFNYVGGAFAYKNSSARKKLLTEEELQKTVLIVDYGKARPVSVAKSEEDPRAGMYPQHNSAEAFTHEMDLLPARSLEPYQDLTDVDKAKAKGFKHKVATLTKDRLNRVAEQFSHLSRYAFHQMMCIGTPDKRDFDIWYKQSKKSGQTIILYPNPKTGLTQFIQVLEVNQESKIIGIKHCVFDQGEAVVVNETKLDSFSNVRQIAHVGVKGNSTAYNSVERFDDGTVVWIITREGLTGAAALTQAGEVFIVGGMENFNLSSDLAARNLGAEGLENDQWNGKFDTEACKADDHPMQKAFKNKAREQIGQIIDGAAIPGLIPVFKI